MYKARHNVWPDSPGYWTSADGEYSFVRSGGVWNVHRLDAHLWHLDSLIGTARTLDGALAIAGRHYVTPLGQWHNV